MKNIALLILILSTGGIIMKLLPVSPVAAAVSGPCPKCHTMHNSQNDSPEKLSEMKDDPHRYAEPTGQNKPECLICHANTLVSLLKTDCLGCHAQAPSSGSQLIIEGTPQISHNAGKGLAAGNYRVIIAGLNQNGHNTHGLKTDQDYLLANTPPGYRNDSDPSALKYNDSLPPLIFQPMCAGSQGCHGDRDKYFMSEAMAGTHHEDDSVLKLGSNFNESLQGTTVGRSYRFLYKIKGIEDPDWQFTSANDDHNEYLGTTYAGVSGSSLVNDSIQTWSNISTISQLCGECHGIFHARYNASGNDGIGAEHAWLRHPSDVLIPNSGEYTKYTNYDVNVPVGRQLGALQTIGAGSKARDYVTPGQDIVICLSCHQAHASNYPDILRWSYSAITSTTAIPNGTACFACHSEKD